MGVRVAVGAGGVNVAVGPGSVGVRVAVGPGGVGVRVAVGPGSVGVRVAVGIGGVDVTVGPGSVGVRVAVGIGGVDVAVGPGCVGVSVETGGVEVAVGPGSVGVRVGVRVEIVPGGAAVAVAAGCVGVAVAPGNVGVRVTAGVAPGGAELIMTLKVAAVPAARPCAVIVAWIVAVRLASAAPRTATTRTTRCACEPLSSVPSSQVMTLTASPLENVAVVPAEGPTETVLRGFGRRALIRALRIGRPMLDTWMRTSKLVPALAVSGARISTCTSVWLRPVISSWHATGPRARTRTRVERKHAARNVVTL